MVVAHALARIMCGRVRRLLMERCVCDVWTQWNHSNGLQAHSTDSNEMSAEWMGKSFEVSECEKLKKKRTLSHPDDVIEDVLHTHTHCMQHDVY